MAFYIVLNAESPAFDTYVDGKILSRHSEILGNIASSVGAQPLEAFFSATLADYADLTGDSLEEVQEWAEDVRAEGGNPPSLEAEWFDPAEGLRTVRLLRKHLAEHPRAASDVEGVLFDLQEFERVLHEAETRGLRWHLSVDY
jgi:hypothetical protein